MKKKLIQSMPAIFAAIFLSGTAYAGDKKNELPENIKTLLENGKISDEAAKAIAEILGGKGDIKNQTRVIINGKKIVISPDGKKTTKDLKGIDLKGDVSDALQKALKDALGDKVKELPKNIKPLPENRKISDEISKAIAEALNAKGDMKNQSIVIINGKQTALSLDEEKTIKVFKEIDLKGDVSDALQKALKDALGDKVKELPKNIKPLPENRKISDEISKAIAEALAGKGNMKNPSIVIIKGKKTVITPNGKKTTETLKEIDLKGDISDALQKALKDALGDKVEKNAENEKIKINSKVSGNIIVIGPDGKKTILDLNENLEVKEINDELEKRVRQIIKKQLLHKE